MVAAESGYREPESTNPAVQFHDGCLVPAGAGGTCRSPATAPSGRAGATGCLERTAIVDRTVFDVGFHDHPDRDRSAWIGAVATTCATDFGVILALQAFDAGVARSCFLLRGGNSGR
jgi:hypothetical protein